jgi:GNAT superfamily N-acetyltransferase
MGIVTKDLTPARWPDLERLFGKNGACGGCWCWSWRVEKGEKWDEIKGDEAKRRLSALVAKKKVHGVIAFDGDEPVGWCNYGPKTDFAKLARSPSLATDDADAVWSIPCFFVKAGSRGSGVATAMLGHALAAMKARGVRVAEGYPVKPPADGSKIPAAFAWTGTRPLFVDAGFEPAGPEGGGKTRVRRRP